MAVLKDESWSNGIVRPAGPCRFSDAMDSSAAGAVLSGLKVSTTNSASVAGAGFRLVAPTKIEPCASRNNREQTLRSPLPGARSRN